MQNTLRGGEEFNWILTHKDTEDIKESWFQPGDMNKVRDIIKDLDPEIASVLATTEKCLDWKICYRDPIPYWVSKGHHIVLLGDCCHPHLPTSAQGASQATESGAVLAQSLLLAGNDNVPLAVSSIICAYPFFSSLRKSLLTDDDRLASTRSFASHAYVSRKPTERMCAIDGITH